MLPISHAGTRYPDVPIQFSLFFFASDEGRRDDEDRYRLILEGARFADEHDFAAVWTPERHFHAFGGLSPNPSVVAAGLAVATQRVQIRSGSVVLPLHHPARVAEEWAVVDHLSHGRVALGVAEGWFPNDFVLAPDGTYEDRKKIFFDRLELLRRLWRGEHLRVTNPMGDEVELQTIPRPLQSELPVWVTAAKNPDTFRRAGEIGANVLTHLLGQSLEELEDKIRIYREAWATAGHPGRGTVSLMLHTFVDECEDAVREHVRAPMKKYLASSVNLVQNYVDSLPLFDEKPDVDVTSLSEEVIDEVLEYSFERYYQTSSLFGTTETCVARVDRLKELGIDDVACLVDFGVETDKALVALERLDEVRRLSNSGEGSPAVAPASTRSEPVRGRADEVDLPGSAELERGIVEIWRSCLGVSEVRPDDNFFDLGGHSLVAVRVQASLIELTGHKLPITDLFRYPTVRSLARHLAGDPDAAAAVEASRERGAARKRALSARRRRRS